MAVLINFKICDNAKECNGIAICATGALSWDEKKNQIKIDNKKCIDCGKCEKACMVNAIFVAKNQRKYQLIEKQIKEDPRKISDLFVDRYGAQPIWLAFIVSEDKFKIEILESKKMVALEIYEDNSIECLLKSIPIKDILSDFPVKYRKMKWNKDLAKKYKIKKLPALLFFREGKLLGKIDGYYSIGQRNELIKKVESLLKKFQKI